MTVEVVPLTVPCFRVIGLGRVPRFAGTAVLADPHLGSRSMTVVWGILLCFDDVPPNHFFLPPFFLRNLPRQYCTAQPLAYALGYTLNFRLAAAFPSGHNFFSKKSNAESMPKQCSQSHVMRHHPSGLMFRSPHLLYAPSGGEID